MTGISFGTIGKVSATPSVRRLKPWEIHEVTFAGCKVETIQGKKNPEAVYEILKIRFENDNGYYEEPIFFVTSERDVTRNKYTDKNGHERELPSTHERNMLFAKQLINDVNPKALEKFVELCGKISSYKDFAALIIKLTDPVKNKHKTRLKLVGKTDKDGNINAVLPNFANVNKDGGLFCSDVFLGPNAEFSAYEKGKREEYLNAKPTDMTKVAKEKEDEIVTDNKDIEEIDTTELITGLDL